MPFLALKGDAAAVPLYDVFDVTESESKAFYIVDVAFRDTVETFEHARLLGLRDADAIIRDTELQPFPGFAYPDVDIDACTVCRHILQSLPAVYLSGSVLPCLPLA